MVLRKRAVLMLVTMVISASCDGGAPERTKVEATTRPSATPSPPSFVNGSECPPATDDGLPEDAGCVSVATSGSDVFMVYALIDAEGRPRSWRMRSTTAAGEIDQPLAAGLDYPRAVGAADVNGDGEPEWWAKVFDYASHGAPWARLNVFFTIGDRLIPLRYEGEPLAINYGGISRLGEGAECRAGALVLLRAEAQDQLNAKWVVSERVFRVVGRRAEPRSRSETTLVVEDYNDPSLRRNFRVECHGATFIPF